MKYLKQRNFFYTKDSQKASKEEILSLLDKVTDEDDIIKGVKQYFPLNEDLNIAGSKEAIDIFNEIDNRKYDYDLSLKLLNNFSFKRESAGSSNYKLNFSVIAANGKKTLIPKAETIYDAKKKLLDLLLEINEFSNFMLKNGCEKEIVDELNTLSKNKSINNKVYNFRFIDSKYKDVDHTFLRSVVTKNRYKTYDNPIVLYISFIIIHNFSKSAKISFLLDSMHVTDSKLTAFFLEESGTKIDKNIFVTTGLNISNSELGDGSAKFNSVYRVENSYGKKVTVINNELTTINHGYNPDTINKSLKSLENLEQNRKDTIAAVKRVNWSKKISRDDVLTLMTLIGYMRKVPSQLKESMRESIRTIDLTKQAYNLLDVFDKLDDFLQNEDPNINLIMEAKFRDWLTKF